MNDDLDQLLKNLKLRRMREVLRDELARAEKKKPSYSDFLARILREEYQHQQVRFLEYRIDRANLPERWSLETFPWQQQPSIDKPQIEQLAELDFIARAANLVFIGNTGVGKTGLASAILLKALQHGHRGLFVKSPGPVRRHVQKPRRSLLAHAPRPLDARRPVAH